MSGRRPSKPWRVMLTGPDVSAESDHGSETAAYSLVRAALGGDSPADTAKILHWENGRWWHHDTLHPEEAL